jgi:membrane-bound metal-dependent hydrolase YbcI (DUF457 family)
VGVGPHREVNLDNVTHTLFAATLARTPLGRAGRGTTAALVIASNIPDIDIVTTAGGAVSYLRWHRGPTHGPIGIVILGLVTAAIVTLAYRLIARLKGTPPPRAPSIEESRGVDGARGVDEARGVDGARGFSRASDLASFPMLAIVSTIGALLHVLMDLPTSYGTRVLSPFSWRWFAVDWMPIIDVWLIAVLVAGLMFGRRSSDARRWNAVIVLTLMAANYGLRGAAHHQALGLAPRLLGPTMPQTCDGAAAPARLLDSWPPPAITPPATGKRCLVEIAALPAFVSPFSWRIVAQMSNAYEIYEVNLLDRRFSDSDSMRNAFWRQSRRYPNVWTPAVERAATTHVGRVFLGFSRFPAARWVVDAQGSTIVRWTDVRFVVGMISLDQPGPGPDLFTATVRIGADGQILQESLGR